MPKPVDIRPADRKLYVGFVDACENLTPKQWREICRTRAGNKRKIRKADGVWGDLLFQALRRLDSTEADDKWHEKMLLRMKDIADRIPDRQFDEEEATFRALVRLAIRQGAMVRGNYSRCIREPGAADAAKALTEAMEGYVPELPPPSAKARPPKKKPKPEAPKLPAASQVTEDAMAAALEAAMARHKQPPKKMKSGVGEAPPPLAPLIAKAKTGTHAGRHEFMSALLDWATTTGALRAARVEDLPDIPKMIRVLYWFWMDSQSEGVWYFLSESWGGRFWKELRQGCKRIEAKKTLECLDEVDKLLPDGIPETEDAMRAALEAFDDMEVDPLMALDGRYGEAMAAEIPRRLHAWVNDNVAKVERAHRISS